MLMTEAFINGYCLLRMKRRKLYYISVELNRDFILENTGIFALLLMHISENHINMEKLKVTI